VQHRAPPLLLLASSPQVFVIGLAAERAVELARVSTAYRNSDDLSRNFIVMMFDVQLEDHMAKHASSSNFLTEEPICRTFPITHRQHDNTNRMGLMMCLKKAHNIIQPSK
jgi:hypothetical protein